MIVIVSVKKAIRSLYKYWRVPNFSPKRNGLSKAHDEEDLLRCLEVQSSQIERREINDGWSTEGRGARPRPPKSVNGTPRVWQRGLVDSDQTTNLAQIYQTNPSLLLQYS